MAEAATNNGKEELRSDEQGFTKEAVGLVADAAFGTGIVAPIAKKFMAAAAKRSGEKSSLAQAPTPSKEDRRLAELLRDTNPDAIFYVGS